MCFYCSVWVSSCSGGDRTVAALPCVLYTRRIKLWHLPSAFLSPLSFIFPYGSLYLLWHFFRKYKSYTMLSVWLALCKLLKYYASIKEYVIMKMVDCWGVLLQKVITVFAFNGSWTISIITKKIYSFFKDFIYLF